jgi:uncharacterized membrane protein
LAAAFDPLEQHIFATRLVPYRSMTPRDFRRFIVGFCLLTFLASLPFYVIGAWPVAGFMGLDALALYIAFRLNFRSARAYETVDVSPLELVFAKVGARGQREEWRFNPCWVRLEQAVHEEFGTERVTLVSRGVSIEIGAFLGPRQKAELARDLSKALAAARRGARFE